MQNIFMLMQFGLTVVMGLYFYNALKNQKSNKNTLEKDSTVEMEKMRKLREIRLTEPLTEKTRPKDFSEVEGQKSALKTLKASLCGASPQHVLIYGPPGVGKTAVARLVLEHAKKIKNSPFTEDSKFVEIDATTLRFDDRGIADPLIGSVHDPIYQGAGALGSAGIPQPKPGAVTKAHGGILFIDEIGELHGMQMNKLLKVLEDRKVFLDSSYYSSENTNIPNYIRDIFENGLPADFRLVGATTRSPEEIPPALRSRCVEIFFSNLTKMEIENIALKSLEKVGCTITDKALEMVKIYAGNGRDVVNLIQLSSGIANLEKRKEVNLEDVEWIIENGNYTATIESIPMSEPTIGSVNGLAVYGSNIGTVMQLEASVKSCSKGKGVYSITGIIEEEEISSFGRKFKKKSQALSSSKSVITVLENVFNLDCQNYNIHLNFLGGGMVDGPSAGISMVTAIYSAINNIPVNHKVAMTGEVSVLGYVRPIGGVTAKINVAKKHGIETVIIPKENYNENIAKIEGIKIIPVSKIQEVIEIAFLENKTKTSIQKPIYTKTNEQISVKKAEV